MSTFKRVCVLCVTARVDCHARSLNRERGQGMRGGAARHAYTGGIGLVRTAPSYVNRLKEGFTLCVLREANPC